MRPAGPRERRVVRTVRCAVLPLSVLAALGAPASGPAPAATRAASAASPGGPPDGWLDRVRQQIAASEYELTWHDQPDLEEIGPSWHAPNRAHGFRTYFVEDGIRLVPREGAEPSWVLSLTLAGYGRGATLWPVQAPVFSPWENRIDYDRGAVGEEYVNDPKGLKHGFRLAVPPEEAAAAAGATAFGRGVAAPGQTRGAKGDGLVHLDLAIGGALIPVVASDGQAIDFVVPGGARVVRYAELAVTDAHGRVLPSWMEGVTDEVARGIRLVVDDTEAAYPIIVDPLLTSPVWTAESDQAGALFGFSVGTAGDVNGDGYADVIVAADGFDNGQADEGRAFAYLGSASGLSPTPSWTAESDQAGAFFGFSVGTAGDVNGDGYTDVIVGAPYYDDEQTDEGRAFAYLGSASGLSPSPAWTAESDQASAGFGVAVGTAGDVNGDGYADVVVGAQFYDNGQTDEGGAFVYLGSVAGPALAPSWTAECDQAGAFFGFSVGTAGDVNGDGYADVLVGASAYDNGQADEGGAFAYFGSATGLSLSPGWTAEGNQASAVFGASLGTAGDVNGDGYTDVVVGARLYDNGQADEGRAFAYLGSASGLPLSPAWTVESDQANARFSVSVGTAGDVNGDGYADVVVGAQFYDNGQTDEGRAFAYLGSAAGLSLTPIWTAESNQAGAFFGVSVGTAGDVNGDGYADVVVGAHLYDNSQTDEGRAFTYLGSPSGLSLTPSWTAESGQAFAYFGFSVGAAGDVNGDGYADVIVGALQYDNGQSNEGRAFAYLGSASGLSLSPSWTAESNQAGASFGVSVGTAGDVNGDGYADVVVGAYFFDNGQTDEGRAFAYLGSAAGLSLTPAWMAESNQTAAEFGGSVGTAGDVNGDGYADVVVGARFHDNGQTDEGRAFAYLGSAAGLSLTPTWTAESNQAGAFFGRSVGTAGDVNGDGYADVIVGCDDYDNGQVDEGRAFAYFGSASGLSSTPSWTAESNQAGAAFGFSVGTAGDVNGDGYADVIVGAIAYDNGQDFEGRAFAYLGSASGLSLSPSWMAESDQSGASFGNSVGTAGDVNGDGYADVVVGAYLYVGEFRTGRAFAYPGSASGLSPAPAWTAKGDVELDRFGNSVGTAGDVNGDGYADVIVGAYFHGNGESNEGRALVYYGNASAGLALRPRQRRTDDTGPIAHLGAADSPAGFRVAMLGRTPFGRGKVKLEWEVKPLGTPFDGLGLQSGTSWVDTGVDGAALSGIAAGLAAATPYHWRARLEYDPASTPLQQRSRWLTMPWKGWQETMLRTRSWASTPAGSVADSGTPLIVTHAAGGDITLSWGVSCRGTDDDYAIYEGTIGAFYSHVARFCGTGGATSQTLAPGVGRRYYLVVPLNPAWEGSYGTNSAGAERPPGLSACLAQMIGACP